MYEIRKAQQPGPGTELIEHWTGMGAYFGTPSYFMTPAAAAGIRGMGYYEQRTAQQPTPGTQLIERWTGLGCGLCCNKGMGSLFDGTCLFGSGLFCSNSPSDWGVGEWVSIGLGSYVLLSVLDTTRRAGRATIRKGRAVRKAVRA